MISVYIYMCKYRCDNSSAFSSMFVQPSSKDEKSAMSSLAKDFASKLRFDMKMHEFVPPSGERCNAVGSSLSSANSP